MHVEQAARQRLLGPSRRRGSSGQWSRSLGIINEERKPTSGLPTRVPVILSGVIKRNHPESSRRYMNASLKQVVIKVETVSRAGSCASAWLCGRFLTQPDVLVVIWSGIDDYCDVVPPGSVGVGTHCTSGGDSGGR
jgi:hypothetical protein